MSTQKIWDLHMTMEDEFTEEKMESTKQLAESIAEEPGVIWKIWTHEAGTTHFGSTYLFKDIESLENYKSMHLPRLAAVGVTNIEDHIFDIMEGLSRINNAPLGNNT